MQVSYSVLRLLISLKTPESIIMFSLSSKINIHSESGSLLTKIPSRLTALIFTLSHVWILKVSPLSTFLLSSKE